MRWSLQARPRNGTKEQAESLKKVSQKKKRQKKMLHIPPVGTHQVVGDHNGILLVDIVQVKCLLTRNGGQKHGCDRAINVIHGHQRKQIVCEPGHLPSSVGQVKAVVSSHSADAGSLHKALSGGGVGSQRDLKVELSAIVDHEEHISHWRCELSVGAHVARAKTNFEAINKAVFRSLGGNSLIPAFLERSTSHRTENVNCIT